jgi:hypothetical protein
MRRDRTGEVDWGDLSLFASDIRERLLADKLATAAEFDAALGRARPALTEVERRGGDPRFVLGVLASARWRRLRSPGARFPQWIKTLKLVAGDDELHRLIGIGQDPRSQLRVAAADAVRFLEGFVWQDAGPFDSVTTRRSVENARWISGRADQAIAVLGWHLRNRVSSRKGYVTVLAELVEAFELIISRRNESPPVEAVKQRMKRMKGDYYQKFVIPRYRLMFHENHMFLSQRFGSEGLKQCGRACFPRHGAPGSGT